MGFNPDNEFQLTIDFPLPKPERLLTPDEIYDLADQDLLCHIKEDRRIERKPTGYQPRQLGDYFSMWANTPPDGGIVVIGMENDGSVSGCDSLTQSRINELECTGNNFCPDARYDIRRIAAVNTKSAADFLLVFRIFYNKGKVVKTTANKAYRRRGESKYEIPSKEVKELEHEKGEVDFEQEPVNLKYPDSFRVDLIQNFCDRVREASQLSLPRTNEEILVMRRLGIRTEKGFEPNVACTLLFATDPVLRFPGCKVRFLRFEGEFEHAGQHWNAVKDVTFEGPVPKLIQQIAGLLDSQLRTFSKLGNDGKFYADPEYPPPAWYEAVVNACVHRSYNMKNATIFVRMYDDRLVVESPGGFPPFVSPENIYEYSHPRNPHLMSAMFYLDYVKAANEGTRRMRDSMTRLNLPLPEFKESEVGHNTYVRVVLRNNVKQRRVWVVSDVSNIVGEEFARNLTEHEKMVINRTAEDGKINVSQVQRLTSRSWHSSKTLLQQMVKKGLLAWHHRKDVDRDSDAHYTINKKAKAGVAQS